MIPAEMNDDPAPTLEAESPQFESVHTLSADRTYTIGVPAPASITIHPKAAETFTITNNGKEMLRFTGTGDIYVRGELMETNRDVVEGLKRLLNTTPAANQWAKKIEADYIKQIDEEIATIYFGQTLGNGDTLPPFPSFTIPDLTVPLGAIVDSERRIEAVFYDGGANCSVCNLHNEFQTAPYTCYGCSH